MFTGFRFTSLVTDFMVGPRISMCILYAFSCVLGVYVAYSVDFCFQVRMQIISFKYFELAHTMWTRE